MSVNSFSTLKVPLCCTGVLFAVRIILWQPRSAVTTTETFHELIYVKISFKSIKFTIHITLRPFLLFILFRSYNIVIPLNDFDIGRDFSVFDVDIKGQLEQNFLNTAESTISSLLWNWYLMSYGYTVADSSAFFITQCWWQF